MHNRFCDFPSCDIPILTFPSCSNSTETNRNTTRQHAQPLLWHSHPVATALKQTETLLDNMHNHFCDIPILTHCYSTETNTNRITTEQLPHLDSLLQCWNKQNHYWTTHTAMSVTAPSWLTATMLKRRRKKRKKKKKHHMDSMHNHLCGIPSWPMSVRLKDAVKMLVNMPHAKLTASMTPPSSLTATVLTHTEGT